MLKYILYVKICFSMVLSSFDFFFLVKCIEHYKTTHKAI